MLDCCISVAIQMEAKDNQFNWIAESSTQLLPLRTKTVDFGCSNHVPNVAFFFNKAEDKSRPHFRICRALENSSLRIALTFATPAWFGM
jgi:hypothetical protein